MSVLWLLVPTAPLFAALALLNGGRRFHHGLWICCLPALAAALLQPPALDLSILWPGAQWGVGTVLQRGLLGSSALLWLCAALFSRPSLQDQARAGTFQCFWLLSLSGNLLWACAGDALTFYVGFSLMSLAAYGLIIHPDTRRARRAGRLYLQIAITGELVLFTGMMMAWHESGGNFELSTWRAAEPGLLTVVTLLLGLGLKAGFWPLHVWLPLAHPAAPAAASAVLSGAMIKAGIAGLWLLLPADTGVMASVAMPALVLGLVSIFYGALTGLACREAKQALAYSSVSQMGYLLLITALAWLTPAAQPALLLTVTLYAVHHGFAKGSLFMAAELVKTGGARSRAALAAGLLLPALAIGGLPLTSGAAAKTALKDALPADTVTWMGTALSLAALASTLIMLRAVWLLWKTLPAKAPHGGQSVWRLTGWALPAAAAVLLPWTWPAMRSWTVESLSLYSLWQLSWPPAMAVLLTIAVRQRLFPVPPMPAITGSSVLFVSLRLRRALQRPAIPAPDPEQLPQRRSRRLERRWNRLWPESTINNTVWLLLVILLLTFFI